MIEEGKNERNITNGRIVASWRRNFGTWLFSKNKKWSKWLKPNHMHKAEYVLENKTSKILWNYEIQTDHHIPEDHVMLPHPIKTLQDQIEVCNTISTR